MDDDALTSGPQLDLQTVLDGMAHAVLVFDAEGRLRHFNRAARRLFSADFRHLVTQGWSAAAALFTTRTGPTINEVQAEAMASGAPVPFHITYNGERLPCRASAIYGASGEPMMLVTAESTDWTALREIFDRFVGETRGAIVSTLGHADLIRHSLAKVQPDDSPEKLSRRISGFVRLISIDMARSARLLDLMARLQAVRAGTLRAHAEANRRPVEIEPFLEDLLEELDGGTLVDPDTDGQDFRSRVTLECAGSPVALAVPTQLAAVLRDVLRNAIMYSMRGTPITLSALTDADCVEIHVADLGYGIRAGEVERVFQPFERARQPQIISEFGYGLSLYLCKHEVEAMGGRLWFESEVGVGTTFTIRLPAYDAAAVSRSSSSSVS